jgi:MoxR-like ATPase
MSRPEGESAPGWVKEYISWGVGPRAAQALIRSAKAHTLLAGRFSVTRADVRAVALPVLRHRLVPSFHAEAEGLGPDDIVDMLLDDVPTFNPRNEYDEVSRRILRL